MRDLIPILEYEPVKASNAILEYDSALCLVSEVPNETRVRTLVKEIRY